MQAIARVQTDDRLVNQLQQNFINAVNPVLANPVTGGIILKKVSMFTGDNTIFHGLGHILQGWIIVKRNSGVTIFDKQDTNATPQTTLVLNVSGSVTADIYVF